MKTIKSLLLVAVFLCAIPYVSAQDMEAKKFEDAKWYEIVYVDYKGGKTGDAREIIEKYFKEAGSIASTTPPIMEFALYSGEYDYVYIWELQEGLETLNWDISPDNVKWWKAMIEVSGSEEEAERIQNEYSDMVARSKSELVRKTN